MPAASDRLRAAAVRLQPKIDAKRDPAIAHQNLTARRARIAAGMAREADRLEAVQRVLLHLADLVDEGELPAVLAKVTSAAAVELLASWGPNGKLPSPDPAHWCAPARAKLARLGIDTDGKLGEAWRAVETVYKARPAPTRAQRLQALERSLIDVRFPGFFPTPAPLADRVCAAARLEPGHRVLEPSAGKGDLVEAVLRAEPTCRVFAIERAGRLVDVMKVRFEEHDGVEAICADFLEEAPILFDRVVMNPPFERYEDRDHVLHALRWLRPGGRLVSIMGAGSASFGRGVEAFTDALDSLCRAWSIEDLPEGAFQGAGAFRQTGVRTVLLTAEL